MSSITNLNQGNAVVNEHGTSKHAKTDGWASRDTLRVKKGQMTFNAIELQVPHRLPLALFCLDFYKFNIHA